ncbi:MAG: DUF4412 domain-containing protein [Bacteroidia bacterium]
MKILSSVFVVFLALACPVAAQNFEGTVTMSHSLYQGLITTFYIQGDQAAVISGGNATDANTRTVVNRTTGEYLVINEANVQAQVTRYNLGDPQFALPDMGKAEVTATGETRKIDGYTCEKFLVNQGGLTATLWVAASLADLHLADFMTPVTLRREGRFLNVPGISGFPLEIETTDLRSGAPVTLKQTVKSGKTDAQKLTIPAGAVVIEMSTLTKQVDDAGRDREKLKEIKQNMNQN